jgi:D-3-phosphoglycerate dehydrogenase
MGEHGVNIANFTLGRKATGGDAIALLYLDDTPNVKAMESLRKTGMFQTVSALRFED